MSRQAHKLLELVPAFEDTARGGESLLSVTALFVTNGEAAETASSDQAGLVGKKSGWSAGRFEVHLAWGQATYAYARKAEG